MPAGLISAAVLSVDSGPEGASNFPRAELKLFMVEPSRAGRQASADGRLVCLVPPWHWKVRLDRGPAEPIYKKLVGTSEASGGKVVKSLIIATLCLLRV